MSRAHGSVSRSSASELDRRAVGEVPRVADAIDVCRQRRVTSVLSDPLGHAEVGAGSAECLVDTPMRAEVDLITRPKQGGGTRVEVVPDFITSVRLQLITDGLGEEDQPQAYQSWWETVPTWIRLALVEGFSVVVADIDSYFASMPTSGIERALNRLELDERSIETTLQAISDINAVPHRDGGTRTGLPVTNHELIWLIADAVLRPVDDHVARDPLVARHIRWVDDFFLAVDSNDVDRALASLSASLDTEGFRLNERKTRVLDSLVAYERQALTTEHRVVTSLAMIRSPSDLSTSQQRAFAELVEGNRSPTPEHAQLWKRTYALAERQRSPALVPQAFDDLDRYPTAERQIASYLRALHWPCGTADRAAAQVADAPTDSQAIALLRALLSTPRALEPTTAAALRHVSESAADRLHPYAMVLLYACLMLRQPRQEGLSVAPPLLSLATKSESALARRIAIELLWLMPESRPLLEEAIGRDTSPTVRGLSTLLAIARCEPRRAARLVEEQPVDRSWGSLGTVVRRTWMCGEA